MIKLNMTSKFYSVSFGQDYILIEGGKERPKDFCPGCTQWHPEEILGRLLSETVHNVVVAFYGTMARNPGCGLNEAKVMERRQKENPKFKVLYNPPNPLPEKFAEIKAEIPEEAEVG